MKLDAYLRRLVTDLADYADGDAEYQSTMNLCEPDCGFVWSVVDRAQQATGTEYPTPTTATEGLAILARLMVRADDVEAPEEPVGERPYMVTEVARLLGVSASHVYDLCREGAIPCNRHGTRITITLEQLEEYQRQSQRQPTQTGFRHF